ncbi:MAG: aldolase/citrate lyase family protein [Alcaligenaceae bacterium]
MTGITTQSGTNLFRQKMQAGQLALGTFVFSPDPCHTEIIGMAGFDVAVIDLEHAPMEIPDVINHIRAANAVGMSCWARIRDPQPQDIGRLLDQGVQGIVLPHFGLNVEKTKAVLDSFRYAPGGTRGTCTGVRAVSYGLDDFKTYSTTSDEEVMAIGLIEDASVVENIEAVLGNCGLDAILPGGPGDLATSMGLHGQGNHPRVLEAIKKVVSAAKQVQGLKVGVYLTDPQTASQWIDLGVDFFLCSIDYRIMANAYKKLRNDLTSQ